MAILTHGSDLTLAPTITPLVKSGGGTVRRAMSAIAEAGFPAVQLDAALRGTRPRELGPSARRDLFATAARVGLRVAGLELFVPRKHLIDSAHVDRATAALVDAIELAGELGRVTLSTAMPVDTLTGEVGGAILEAADGHGVPLAIHAEGELDAAAEAVASIDRGSARVGLSLDPATLILQGHDPAAAVQQHGKALVAARLSDADRGLGQRVSIGQGDLDVAAYRIGVDLASSRPGPVVLDLRGLHDPAAAMRLAAEAWEDATFTLDSPHER